MADLDQNTLEAIAPVEAYRRTCLWLLRELRLQGYTAKESADYMNEKGHCTVRGRPFKAANVHRILTREGKGDGR